MQISIQEKMILSEIAIHRGTLPFEKKKIDIQGYDFSEEEYIIPKDEKKKTFEALYPFVDDTTLESTRFCLHSGKTFKVSDYRVIDVIIDGKQFPMIASPEYHLTGGTVIDWIDKDEKNTIQIVKKR